MTATKKDAAPKPQQVAAVEDVVAPASRTVYRDVNTGRIATADVAAANPKGYAAEALATGYAATVVNVAGRASGLRVTLDIEELSAQQADLFEMEGAKVRVAISV